MGRTLPDVPLVLTNLQSKAKHEVRSDATGRFEFVGLPPADYSLENRYPGFEWSLGKLTMTGLNVQQNVKLQIGGLEETVTVDYREAPRPVSAPVQRVPRDLSKCTVPPTGGGYIQQPWRLAGQPPQYPPQLRGTGTVGVVVLEGKIGTDGLISNVQTIGQAQPDLANAAIEGIQQWQYSETLLDCVSVEVAVRVTVNFIAARSR